MHFSYNRYILYYEVKMKLYNLFKRNKTNPFKNMKVYSIEPEFNLNNFPVYSAIVQEEKLKKEQEIFNKLKDFHYIFTSDNINFVVDLIEDIEVNCYDDNKNVIPELQVLQNTCKNIVKLKMSSPSYNKEETLFMQKMHGLIQIVFNELHKVDYDIIVYNNKYNNKWRMK